MNHSLVGLLFQSLVEMTANPSHTFHRPPPQDLTNDRLRHEKDVAWIFHDRLRFQTCRMSNVDASSNLIGQVKDEASSMFKRFYLWIIQNILANQTFLLFLELGTFFKTTLRFHFWKERALRCWLNICRRSRISHWDNLFKWDTLASRAKKSGFLWSALHAVEKATQSANLNHLYELVAVTLFCGPRISWSGNSQRQFHQQYE